MSYWQLFYHLIWATKDHKPLLTDRVEAVIHSYLRARTAALGGAVFAVGGTPDHVHMVAAIPPKLSVATFVGQVKSASSARYNRAYATAKRFVWQEEYGAFSFDRKRLPHVIEYVEQQKEHHASGTVIPILERVQGGAPQLVREPEAGYYIDNQAWRKEMLALDTELFDA